MKEIQLLLAPHAGVGLCSYCPKRESCHRKAFDNPQETCKNALDYISRDRRTLLANRFMLGNIVLYHHRPMRVSAIYASSLFLLDTNNKVHVAYNNKVQPYELTDEILSILGFTPENKFQHLLGPIFSRRNDGCYINDIPIAPYVHSLQNAFYILTQQSL